MRRSQRLLERKKGFGGTQCHLKPNSYVLGAQKNVNGHRISIIHPFRRIQSNRTASFLNEEKKMRKRYYFCRVVPWASCITGVQRQTARRKKQVWQKLSSIRLARVTSFQGTCRCANSHLHFSFLGCLLSSRSLRAKLANEKGFFAPPTPSAPSHISYSKYSVRIRLDSWTPTKDMKRHMVLGILLLLGSGPEATLPCTHKHPRSSIERPCKPGQYGLQYPKQSGCHHLCLLTTISCPVLLRPAVHGGKEKIPTVSWDEHMTLASHTTLPFIFLQCN